MSILTAEDRAVLAHLVIDPDEWILRALANGHPEHLLEKVRRDIHVAAYRSARAKEGARYRQRHEVEAPLPDPMSPPPAPGQQAARRPSDAVWAQAEAALQAIADRKAARESFFNNLFKEK